MKIELQQKTDKIVTIVTIIMLVNRLSTPSSIITFKKPFSVAPSVRGDRGCEVYSSDETDDQGVTLDILRVAGEVETKFSPSETTFESDCSDWDSSIVTPSPRKKKPYLKQYNFPKRPGKYTSVRKSRENQSSESVYYINDDFYDSLSSGAELENKNFGKLKERFFVNNFQDLTKSELCEQTFKKTSDHQIAIIHDRNGSLSPVIPPIREQLNWPITKHLNMSDSNMTSSDSDKSSEMTKLKNKKPVVKSSSSESFDEDDKQVSKVKKKRLRKSQNNSDSDSSHIEPSQFRSPKLNNYQILKTSPEKTTSSKSIKKSGASKSHDISSNSEDDSDVESTRRNKSPRKRKHEETSDESSSDSSKSSKSLQKIQKKQKEKPRGQGKSSQKLSRSTVLSSASDDEEEETSRSKSTKKSQASPSNKPSRDESDSTDLSDIHALAESNPEDLELWLIKVPAKVPLSSLPQQVLTDGIQDFSKHKKRYELISFPDEMIQRDHVSFVQGKSHQLLEGPCVKGQMQIVSKPSALLRPVTAPLISHKPVPFPATLKVRFTPFGADAPASVNKSPKSRKHKKKKVSENEDTSVNGVEDVDASPRKKKKKKKKHSID